MRLIVQIEPGVAEVNWTWLPSWLGLNSMFLKQLGEHLKPQLLNLRLDQGTLDLGHELAKNYIVSCFPNIEGLAGYLDAIRLVKDEE
jgi:hypothetical protein